MSAIVPVEIGMVRHFVPVEWCETCGMSMPADHENFRHADNPHLYPVQAGAPSQCPAEDSLKADEPRRQSAMSIIPEDERRARVIDGLRQLATYLDEHPEVPVGIDPIIELGYAASALRADDEARAEVDRVADLIGAVPETSAHHTYSAAKTFGPARYRVFAIPKADMRRSDAHMTYADSVTPEAAS